ncbi:MAG: hypothetical protein RR240_08460 [Burkholderiaceae bacterium]
MSDTPLLRLALQGFTPAEAAILSDMVHAAALGWSVADTAPIHAMLLARGSRDGDPEHAAVLRVNLGYRPVPRANERRMEPLLLRKPIREATLRMALKAARTRFEVYGDAGLV